MHRYANPLQEPHITSQQTDRRMDFIRPRAITPLQAFCFCVFSFCFRSIRCCCASSNTERRVRKATPSVGRLSASSLLKPIPTQRPHFLLNLKREATLTMWRYQALTPSFFFFFFSWESSLSLSEQVNLINFTLNRPLDFSSL